MVKELNNMKNKKSNSYRPYDSSNSFVRRVTTRVSQLLPQPTSWLSRFLSRGPEQAGPVESQEGDDEEVIHPPPSKRKRTVHTSTEFPLYLNNVAPLEPHRLEERREDELSPIRSYMFSTRSGAGRSEDLNAPGPSGLSRHHGLVASTPAAILETHPNQIQQPKVNGDDGSESDSGSHVSSLPPEGQASQSLFRSLNLNKPKTSRRIAQEELNNSLLRSKQLKLDLSSSSLSSSRGRVSFDATVFNSPFKGRLCGGLSVSRDESAESLFYRSNTTFGGASSCSDSLLRTRSLHSEVPIVVQPSQPQRTSDNLASSTKKILKALEQFSTPMVDQSRRLQGNNRGLKRKVEVPYKELVIPQMPDLLRIKRRDARHARQLASASSLSSQRINSIPAPTLPTIKEPSVEATASESSTSHLALRLSKYEESGKEKIQSYVDKRVEENKKRKDSSSLMTGLPLTTLPKFDADLVKQLSTPSNVTQASMPELRVITAPSVPKPSVNQFTFSKPIDVAVNDTPSSSIPPSKTFSRPLDPEAKISESKPLVNCVNIPQPKGAERMMYFPPSNLKLKKKEIPGIANKSIVSTSSELKGGSVMDVLSKPAVATPTELKSGSVMDVLKKTLESNKKPAETRWECQGCYVSNESFRTNCAACEQPRKQVQASNSSKLSAKGFGDEFKISSNEWECKSCLIRNNVKDTKCVACGDVNSSAKLPVTQEKPKSSVTNLSGFGDKFKPPAGSWECGVCLVQNKANEFKCVSCSTDKPGASQANSNKASTPSLGHLIKKPEGSWECDACFVMNKKDAISCISCSTNKPGAKVTNSAPTFSFGIPPSSTAPSSFSFGVSSTCTTSSTQPTSSFVSSFVPSTQTATPTFTFGIPSSVADKTPSTSVSNSIFSSAVNTIMPDNKSKETVNSNVEAGKPSESNLKTEPFTFGLPSKVTEAGSSTPNTKSIFGSVTTSTVSNAASIASIVPATNAPSTLPIFVNQISSSKSPVVSSEKVSAPATTSAFTFGSSSSSLASFGKSAVPDVSKVPEASSVFGTHDNEVKPMATSPVTEEVITNSIVSSDKNIPEVKTNLFTFGSSNTAEKKTYLNSNADTPSTTFSTHSPVTFNSPSTAAPVKPAFTFTSGFSAGSNANQIKTNTTANAFGTHPVQQQPSTAEGGFSYKPSEPTFNFTQKKSEPSSTPFQFGTSAANHTNNFNSTTPASNQFNSGFGSAASSPFSTQGSIFGSSAPQPVQTASFLFGASQTNDRPPPAPTFNFAAQNPSSAANNVCNTSVAGGFAFGQTQNSAPVQPPAFDPNAKPVFNFSGGQTPIFSATAAPGTGTEERKIRKAFRRTTQK